MRKFPLMSGILLFISMYNGTHAHSICRTDTIEGRLVPLFNGKNLEGWYTFIKDRGTGQDPKGVFSVQDNMLRITGEELGYLATNEEYADYRLIMEFKWGTDTHEPRKIKARDSGVLLHSVGEDGGVRGIWMNSIECNIIEGGTGDFILIGSGSDRFSITGPVVNTNPEADHWHGRVPVYKQGGELLELVGRGRIHRLGKDPDWKDTLGYNDQIYPDRPAGEWNMLECVVWKDSIDLYLNGVLVNQAINVRPTKGRILVQSEGAEMFVRRIDLMPITTFFKPN